MYSKAKIGSHPLHPMLVAFPIAFYVGALVSFVVYAIDRNPFWFRVGVVANIAGIVMALVAAIPGFIDWAVGVPKNSPAKSTGLSHMLLQVGALAVFVINAVLQWQKWDMIIPSVGSSVLLSVIGTALMAGGGLLGWKMIATHHVGIDLTPEQERIEPVKSERNRRMPEAAQHP